MTRKQVDRGNQPDSPIHTAGAHGVDPRPCSSGRTYSQCCEPSHNGALTPTVETLICSRYMAFVIGDEDYLFRAWRPHTCPEGPYCYPGTRWTGLAIHETIDGGPDDETGIVEFATTYRSGSGRGGVVDGALREHFHFTHRIGRWLYLNAIG